MIYTLASAGFQQGDGNLKIPGGASKSMYIFRFIYIYIYIEMKRIEDFQDSLYWKGLIKTSSGF